MIGNVGIYCITNKLNGKVYIGQSWNIRTRFRDYKTKCHNIHLDSALKMYGFNNFHWGILETFENPTQEMLDSAESDYITATNATNREYGYNIRYGGSHGKHSDESKQKISQIQIGKKLSKEHKNKIGEKSKGRFYSQETRQKIGLVNKGKKRSEESKIKMSLAHIGKKLSPESIAKRTETQKKMRELRRNNNG